MKLHKDNVNNYFCNIEIFLKNFCLLLYKQYLYISFLHYNMGRNDCKQILLMWPTIAVN